MTQLQTTGKSLHTTTNDTKENTANGLEISKKLAKLHNLL